MKKRTLLGYTTLVVGLAAVLALDVSVNVTYGELVAGLRWAPNVCADLILKGPADNGSSFYIGTHCDY